MCTPARQSHVADGIKPHKAPDVGKSDEEELWLDTPENTCGLSAVSKMTNNPMPNLGRTPHMQNLTSADDDCGQVELELISTD